jgi:hypothetical protein
VWLLVLAIVVLVISGTFAAYLTEFYTTSFGVATFPKSVSMALIITGEVMIFVAVGWWGFAGLFGVWLWFTGARVFYQSRFETYVKSGVNPHRTFRDR